MISDLYQWFLKQGKFYYEDEVDFQELNTAPTPIDISNTSLLASQPTPSMPGTYMTTTPNADYSSMGDFHRMSSA